MNFLYVIMVLLLHDGSQMNISTVPVEVAQNVDPDLVCDAEAVKLAERTMKTSSQAPDDMQVDKFDYVCVPAPDWDSEPAAEDYLKDMKSELAKQSA